MSHSKYFKRGKSLYIENWNSSAKRFINVCTICGAQGYSPSIEDAGFLSDSGNNVNYEHRATQAELMRALKPLPLDSLGRCEICAKMVDKD